MEIVNIKLPEATELKLAPVGDIQYGAASCDVGKLERHLKYGVEHGWKFIGMGDYLDHFSPSNRRRLVAARGELYDSARELLDEAVWERMNSLGQILEPSRGHWLGLVHGDHAWEFQDGQWSDDILAGALGAKSLQKSAIVKVKVGQCPVPLRIFVTHGAGASINPTGKTLHLERLSRSYDADIYLIGHAHLKYGVPIDKLEAVSHGGKEFLVARTKILGVTGSFMSGVQQGSNTYVEEKALSPVPTGGLLIECRPVKEEWGWRWDMFVTA